MSELKALGSTLHVLMLNNEFPPLGGGTGSVTSSVLAGLVAYENIEIDLITSGQYSSLSIEQLSDNINLYRVPIRITNVHHARNRDLIEYAIKAFLLSCKLMRKRRYHVCLAWCSVPAGVLALALRWIFKVPYIVRVSGPDLPGFEDRYQRTVRLLMPLLKLVWKSARLVVAKCEPEGAVVQRCQPNSKVQISPNGVDLSSFHPAASGRVADSPLRILCVGRLIERKGQEALIRACHTLKERGKLVRLTLAGDGDRRPHYEHLVYELSLEQEVEFLGYVSRADIGKCYRAADVFVLPSSNESMSVATLEALASGLPVISSAEWTSGQLVKHGENGFVVEFGSVPQLVDALQDIAEHPEQVEQFAAVSRQIAQEFSWDVVVARYARLFTEIGSESHT